MKKALMLTAAVAALSASSAAHAWGVGGRGLLSLVGRPIFADGLGPIGVVDMMAPLGRDGLYCSYLMNWGSAFNPNIVTSCVLSEARTPINPSCAENAYGLQPWTATAVLSGSFAGGAGWGGVGQGFCQGFDLMGVPWDVSIVAGVAGTCLTGIVLYDCFVQLPFTI
ncbi:MAG: hypothetical protein R3F14_38835 [Polyangiaceae bacterium]